MLKINRCTILINNIKMSCKMFFLTGGTQLIGLRQLALRLSPLRCINSTVTSADGRILPLIRVPINMQGKIRKIQQKQLEVENERKRKVLQRGSRTKPVITCRNSELNYYEDQVYSKLEVVQLASQNWANGKSYDDYFTINSTEKIHPSLVNDNESKLTFEELNLRPELYEKLNEMELKEPSNIQALAIPYILNGENTMCAAETGSGKTLAYLLPMVDNILTLKENVDEPTKYNSPLSLILVPSRELANQIHAVTLKLTNSLPITTAVLVGGEGTKRIMRTIPMHNVDILISSLGVIKKLVSSGVYSLSRLNHVVIDESDTMLDDSFNEPMLKFLKKIKFRDCVPSFAADPNVGAQMTLVGATLPTDLEVLLRDIVQIRTVRKLTTSHLHRIMNHVSQTFLRLRKSDKPAKLLELVKNDVKKGRPVMVFTKNSKTTDYIQMFFNENGVNVISFHSDMSAFWRRGRLDKFQQGLCDVITCTDLASRGIDTTRVQHIINYDFPLYVSDYIHRVGRAGRLTSVGTGKVTNFVTSANEIAIVQKIEMAARKMEMLSEVNANIKGQMYNKIKALEDSEYL